MDLTKLSTLELEALIGRVMTQIDALQRDLQAIRGELSRRPPVQIPAPPKPEPNPKDKLPFSDMRPYAAAQVPCSEITPTGDAD